MRVKIVIACAGKKAEDAGYWTTEGGKTVKFIGNPTEEQNVDGCIYARPDDIDEKSRKTWRELLLEYNCQWRGKDDNLKSLLPAYRLYSNSIYRALVVKYGVEQVFILSAGWGLIRSDFLTPHYDITFTNGTGYKQRKQSDAYRDCNEMPDSAGEKIYLFAGKDYHELFSRLIQGKGTERIVFYNAQGVSSYPGCTMKEYPSSRKTTWYYQCALDFMNGAIPSVTNCDVGCR